MPRPLPYPGHTWSLSQHAIGLDPVTLYNFLKCAAPFEGQSSGYDDKITELVIAAGILTPNQRNGSPDAWRDYQQLLAELGLIYSTKMVRSLTLTELGHMFLAGEIGFAELIGTQALRYQYPNGQKSTVQSRLGTALSTASISTPRTLTEFQASLGILIKPGTLILRVLLSLAQGGHQSSLTTSECQAFLLPCKTNREWPIAFAEVMAHRRTPSNIDAVNDHARRNIQDWFKFLGKSDYFETVGPNTIKLSQYSLQNVSEIASYCSLQEDPATYWIPTSFDIQGRIQWFDFFGHLSYEAQSSLRSDVSEDQDYLAKNYVAGGEVDDDDTESALTRDINLAPLDLIQLVQNAPFKFTGNIDALVEGLRRGAQKRHAKTLLHDKIIAQLAERFVAQGARVESDPNSIDLFAAWPDGNSGIFEVKTVTRKSLQGRLRSAVGQVQEYDYRRQSAGAGPSDRIVVINTELSGSSWQTSFLTQHLGIGLICKSPNQSRGYAPTGSVTQQYWTP
jgi:hypothetical protein